MSSYLPLRGIVSKRRVKQVLSLLGAIGSEGVLVPPLGHSVRQDHHLVVHLLSHDLVALLLLIAPQGTNSQRDLMERKKKRKMKIRLKIKTMYSFLL
jgi:hypothetical protein